MLLLTNWYIGNKEDIGPAATTLVDATKLRIGVFSEKTILRHEFRPTYLFEFQYQLNIVFVCKLSYLI